MKAREPRRGAPAAFATALLFVSGAALADETDAPRWEPGRRTTSRLPNEIDADDTTFGGDGVYGRFDALFDVGLEAGAAFEGGRAFGAARASVHYVFMAGAYAGYEDAFGGDVARSTRTVSLGVDLRPAFIPRWSNDLQLGEGFFDLVIDSISLGTGVYFREPISGALGDVRGLELSLGFGVPLMGAASGLWLGARGYLRWDDPMGREAPAAEGVGVATVGYHFMAGGG